MAFLTTEQLDALNFKSIGSNVKISEKASIYNAKNISLGNNVRIDDFCILSAGKNGIDIGDHVHIACYASLIGEGKITVEDFAGISSKVSLYSSTDDFSGTVLTGPTVDSAFTNVISAPVVVGRHSVIGSGCVVMPNVTIGMGSAIGALSLIVKDCEPFKIYGGVPAKVIKERSRDILAAEERFKTATSVTGKTI